jgi:hypothetical protein
LGPNLNYLILLFIHSSWEKDKGEGTNPQRQDSLGDFEKS